MSVPEIPTPHWLVKGKTLKFPDGTVISFGGKTDNLIIVTDEGSKTHATFTIKTDQYELHTTKRTKNVEYRKDFFKINSPVIAELVEHWTKIKPKFVKIIETKFWLNHPDLVLDADSPDIPKIRWLNMFSVHPEDLAKYGLKQSQVIKMGFRVGFTYNPESGNCTGMIIPYKKKKQLIMSNRVLSENIINTAIGIDWLKQSLEEEFSKNNE